MRGVYFLWGALVMGVGASLFLLKYKVQSLEHDLVARQEQVVKDRAAIRVLQAEWTYLNDPERLRRLSGEYLGFGPPAQRNIANVDALPFRKDVNAPAQVQQPTVIAPLAPQVHADAAPEPNARVVLFQRLQNLLFPASAGAATFPSNKKAH